MYFILPDHRINTPLRRKSVNKVWRPLKNFPVREWWLRIFSNNALNFRSLELTNRSALFELSFLQGLEKLLKTFSDFFRFHIFWLVIFGILEDLPFHQHSILYHPFLERTVEELNFKTFTCKIMKIKCILRKGILMFSLEEI